MTVADYIAKRLAERRVPAVFELVGGMITFLIDAIHRQGKIQLVSMHHEQAAAFAAEACARMTGIPGVALATSGPGATNLVTGIGSCYFDSTPAVFITGQVNRSEQRGTSAVRQLGFQETDIVRMVEPIVKRAWAVKDPNSVPSILEEAFATAISGRPGPVLIDIPMDVQRASITCQIDLDTVTSPQLIEEDMPFLDAQKVCHALRIAKCPLILAGGGIRSAGAVDVFRTFVNTIQIPVVHSLMGVDVLPSAHPLNLGMIGSYGNRWSNIAISKSDLLLVLGSRLDVRQTGSDTDDFKRGRDIFHVDCDSAEINNRVRGCHAIAAHLRPGISKLLEVCAPLSEQFSEDFGEWLETLKALRAQWPDVDELKNIDGINPNAFMHRMASENRDVVSYAVDVGQHQMWAAQSLEIQEGQRFLTSGGMGSMGFGLPAAIGSAISAPGKAVTMIAGDGSFQCNIQELQTVVRLSLPIRMVVMNNRCHGMVRQFQQSYFEGRYQSTMWGYSAPDFSALATAYGIPSRTIDSPSQIDDAAEWLAKFTDGPCLLQVMISPFANAYPKLAFGKGIAAMEPMEMSQEMEAT